MEGKQARSDASSSTTAGDDFGGLLDIVIIFCSRGVKALLGLSASPVHE